MTGPNLRLVNQYGEDGGRWTCAPDDTKTLAYARTLLTEYEREEPRSGWRLETRGEARDWHRWGQA